MSATNNPNKEQLNGPQLQKRINLYYNPLFQECLTQWFSILQTPTKFEKLNFSQYLNLNLRLQKSLIYDFDMKSAKQSAIEDWKIDLDRENEVKSLENYYKSGEGSFKMNRLPSDPKIIEQSEISYERLRQFFFDLCASWCQYLDIELFIFFLNALFINISRGPSISESVFKHLGEVDALPVKFYSILLQYRTKLEELKIVFENYEKWEEYNFKRTKEIKVNVRNYLTVVFGERELRIGKLGLGVESAEKVGIGTPNKSSKLTINQKSAAQHPPIYKLGKPWDENSVMRKTILERQMSLQASQGLVVHTTTKEPVGMESYIQGPRDRGLDEDEFDNAKVRVQRKLELKILKRLPDLYKDAKIREIFDVYLSLEHIQNSILVEAGVCLPIFGVQCQIHTRFSRLTKHGDIFRETARNLEELQNTDYLVNIKKNYQNQNVGGYFGMGREGEEEEIKIDVKVPDTMEMQGNSEDTVSYGTKQRAQGGSEEERKEKWRNMNMNMPPEGEIYERYRRLLGEDHNKEVVSMEQLLIPEILKELKQTYREDIERYYINRGVDAGTNIDKGTTDDANLMYQNLVKEIMKYYEIKQPTSPVKKSTEEKRKLINLTKFKINPSWENSFYKYDLVPFDFKEQSAIVNEIGKVNRSGLGRYKQRGLQIGERENSHREIRGNQITKGHSGSSHSLSQVQEWSKPQNPSPKGSVVGEEVPFVNTTLIETLGDEHRKGSGGWDPMEETPYVQYSQQLLSYAGIVGLSPISAKHKLLNSLRERGVLLDSTSLIQQPPIPDAKTTTEVILRSSTDIEGVGDTNKIGDSQGAPLEQGVNIKMLEGLEHMLTQNDIKILHAQGIDLQDPFQYAIFFAKLKNTFNDKYKSSFIFSLGFELPYVSRRHEMGGTIGIEDTHLFYKKLLKLSARVRRKRRNIIKRRKKKGVDLIPRKYIYKPMRRPDLKKNALWNEVFLEGDPMGRITENNSSSSDCVELPPICPKKGMTNRSTDKRKVEWGRGRVQNSKHGGIGLKSPKLSQSYDIILNSFGRDQDEDSTMEDSLHGNTYYRKLKDMLTQKS